MIFRSPEIDARFCLKKQNNGFEVWKNVSDLILKCAERVVFHPGKMDKGFRFVSKNV